MSRCLTIVSLAAMAFVAAPALSQAGQVDNTRREFPDIRQVDPVFVHIRLDDGKFCVHSTDNLYISHGEVCHTSADWGQRGFVITKPGMGLVLPTVAKRLLKS